MRNQVVSREDWLNARLEPFAIAPSFIRTALLGAVSGAEAAGLGPVDFSKTGTPAGDNFGPPVDCISVLQNRGATPASSGSMRASGGRLKPARLEQGAAPAGRVLSTLHSGGLGIPPLGTTTQSLGTTPSE